MNYQKKEMFDTDSEWGFFIDLETYSSKKKYQLQVPNKKIILNYELFTIPENEKKIYSCKNKTNYNNDEAIELNNDSNSNTNSNSNSKSDIIKEKIQFYATLGIFISGIAFTTLLAYTNLI
jgi:hypothetical protein